jgi:hypothetical protein
MDGFVLKPLPQHVRSTHSQPQSIQPNHRQFMSSHTFSSRKQTQEKPNSNPETKKQTETQPAENDRGYNSLRARHHPDKQPSNSKTAQTEFNV